MESANQVKHSFIRGNGGIAARCLTLVLATGILAQAYAAAFYVSPAGNDSDPGSLDRPFASLARGQAAVQAGDTVFLRGGKYYFKSTTGEIAITLSKSGSPGRPIHYLAYPGEIPALDFSGMTAMKRIKGVLVTGAWLHLKGLEMKGILQNLRDGASHENWCLYVSSGADGGGHNVFELLNLHHNMGPGMFISGGAGNLVLNCDSHDNFDLYSYSQGKLTPGENADGFGFHSHNPADTGTVFRGCRAWWNADDGWDFIGSATGVTTENCWSWYNGYKPGTTESAGNGNGFKVGGYGMPPSAYPAKLPQHTVRFCLSFRNKAAGFYQNHHPVANFYYNNTAFDNRSSDFSMLGYDLAKHADAYYGILRNNVAYLGTALSRGAGGAVDEAYNSWDIPGTCKASDFMSIDTSGVSGPRQAGGSLPVLGFMRLNTGSALIDKGLNVKLPFAGSAPDLGAFEYGTSMGLENPAVPRPTGVTRLISRPGIAGAYDLQGRDVEARILTGQGRFILLTPAP